MPLFSRRAGLAGSIALLLVLVAAALSGGCSHGRSAEAVRFCRSLIPAFNDSAHRIEILASAERETATQVLVSLRYRVAGGQGTVERALMCRVAHVPDGLVPKLLGVATEEGPLGEIRLYLLQKTWIDSGAVQHSDPAMVVLLPVALPVPKWLAALLQTLVSALPSIAIYVVLATAYSLVYGLVGRINLAFGEIAIVGGYAAYLANSSIGGFSGNPLNVASAVVVGLFTAGVWGLALGRLVVAPLVSQPGQHVLIATLGASVAMSETLRLTQGAGVRWMPPFLNQPYGIAQAGDHIVTVTPISLLVAGSAFLAAAALVTAMERTGFGRRWRAIADDSLAAGLLGVDGARLLLQTAVVAAVLAGLAGVLTTFSYGGVGSAGGLGIGLKALLAAVLGRLGSVRGAFLGGLLIGTAEAAWAAAFSIESRDIALFSMLIATLIWRKADRIDAGAK